MKADSWHEYVAHHCGRKDHRGLFRSWGMPFEAASGDFQPLQNDVGWFQIANSAGVARRPEFSRAGSRTYLQSHFNVEISAHRLACKSSAVNNLVLHDVCSNLAVCQ